MTIRLNIGSSAPSSMYRNSTEWLNIDIKKYKGVNVQASAWSLPFADDSISEIHCIHVLEHVTRDKHIPMLSEFNRVIKPGYPVFVEVPDFEEIVVNNLSTGFQTKNKRSIHIWTTSIYGKNEIPGMAHHWGFYEELLRDKMIESGFSQVDKETEMISSHWKQEPVLLMRGVK